MARLAFKDKRELREMTWVDLRKFTVWKQGESDGRKRLHPEKRMGFRNTVESLSLNLNCGTDTSPTRPGGNQCDVEIGSLLNKHQLLLYRKNCHSDKTRQLDFM